MVQAIFDRSIYKRNISRFQNKIIKDDFIYPLAEELVQEILDDISTPFQDALFYNPLFKSKIKHNANAKRCTINDFDEEDMELGEEKFDLIVSILSLHLINDTPKALGKYYNALKTNGLFVAALLGGKTFQQLRLASMKADEELYGGCFARIMPTIDTTVAPILLQKCGFTIPVVSSELYRVEYEIFDNLISDLRHIGHGNCLYARKNSLESKHYISTLSKYYGNTPFLNDFEILLLSGSKG